MVNGCASADMLVRHGDPEEDTEAISGGAGTRRDDPELDDREGAVRSDEGMAGAQPAAGAGNDQWLCVPDIAVPDEEGGILPSGEQADAEGRGSDLGVVGDGCAGAGCGKAPGSDAGGAGEIVTTGSRAEDVARGAERIIAEVGIGVDLAAEERGIPGETGGADGRTDAVDDGGGTPSAADSRSDLSAAAEGAGGLGRFDAAAATSKPAGDLWIPES